MSNWASFAPTPAELAYAAQIIDSADAQKLGVITGEAAVPVLNGSNLSREELGYIWTIADHEHNGYLCKKGVAVAVRLIGWAQVGEPVSDSLLLKGELFSGHSWHDQNKFCIAGPLPTISGISKPTSPGPTAQPTTPKPLPAPPLLPPITPADCARFLRLFVNSGPTAGLLSGMAFLGLTI